MNARYSPHCQLTDLLDAAESLRATRHQLHRNPELSFRESATSELVAARLEGWGHPPLAGAPELALAFAQTHRAEAHVCSRWRAGSSWSALRLPTARNIPRSFPVA